jgi:uncharacterized cupin superfamily protein
MSGPVNLYEIAAEPDPGDPAGYRARSARFGPGIGAAQLGGTVYELDPGDSICPYHYENVEEELLLVLTGTPTLRDPDGEHELVEGDLVFFELGPGGAHKVTNRSDAVVRVLMLSTMPEHGLSICSYPDSGKVGVFPPGKMFRLEDAVGYWDGEV